MPTPIRIGDRVFAPSWILTVLAIALCTAFASLGRWQWERGEARAAQWAEFERRADRILPLGSRSLEEVPRFQRVRISGRYDSEHQFLLDNRSYAGRPGYEVLTPFELTDARVVLVNRGWVPFTGYRERLPDVSFEPEASLAVTGRVDELPVAGLASGRVAPARDGPWPKLTSFPSIAELSAALGRRIEPRILLLDPDEPHGYVREWRPPGIEPARHWSYAIQWWGLAILVAILWGVMSMKKVSRS